MQIAATNPLALNVESLDESVVNREKNIFKEQAESQGKPENIIEKMALVHQDYKNGSCLP